MVIANGQLRAVVKPLLGPWKFITFYSQPVQVRNLGAQPFDDYSNDTLTFGIARVQRELFGWADPVRLLCSFHAR